MKRLDALPWAGGFTIAALGTFIGFRTTDRRIVGAVAALLPPVCRIARGRRVDRMVSLIVPPGANPRSERRPYLLFGDGVRVTRTRDREELLRILALFLEELVMAAARSRCVIHAGAVAWHDRAILLPGVSRSGKSRLVEALVQSGAEYLSDEYAILDPKGRVHPYARPMRRRDDVGDDVGRMREVQMDAGLGTAASRPVPVGLVVAARYRPGARWRVQRLSPAQGALALLEHSISARMWSQNAMGIVRRTAASATAMRATRGEAADAARAIIALCEGERVAGGAC